MRTAITAPRSLRAIRLLVLAAAVGALLIDLGTAQARIRDGYTASPKAYIHVVAKELELAWNGDQGESGRGNGEVYLFTMVTWGGAVERQDPQKTDPPLGPLGGPGGVQSGAVYQDPPNSGKYKIRPAKVTEGLGKIYHNYADCPVPTQIRVHARVWEDDNNTDLKFYANLIASGIGALTEVAAPGTPAPDLVGYVTDGLIKLLDWLTYSEDDELGRTTTTVSFSDPCAGFFEKEAWIPLENRAAAVWEDVNAEDSTGTPFSSHGLTPPASIGRLLLRLWGGTLNEDYASAITPPYQLTPPDTNGHWQVSRVDLGQATECAITGTLDVKSFVPRQDPHVSYSMYLDTDHDPDTGSPAGDTHGAEFEVRLPLAETSSGVAPMLYRYDSGSGQFQLVAGAVVSSEIDDDASTVYLTADLQSLDSPADSIAAWAVARSAHGDFVAPPDAHLRAPVIVAQYGSNGRFPTLDSFYPPHGARDIPVGDSLVLQFGERMNRASIPPAFTLDPPVPGTFEWNGNRATFQPAVPLQHGKIYRARLAATAMDCFGAPLDGDDDFAPGGDVTWWFATEPAPLFASTQEGVAKDRFAAGEHLFATGSGFPPVVQADLYVVRHDSLHTQSGWPLLDVTGGPEFAPIPVSGILPPTPLGPVPVEGEYNVVADVNRNGVFDTGIDRIDGTAIGFAVFGRAIDGRQDSGCVSLDAAQTTQTGAGNSTLGQPGFSDGSELNGACMTFESDAVRLFLAGNLRSDFSKLEVFFDCVPGGQERLRGDNAVVDGDALNRMGSILPGLGLKFDLGFTPDYWIGLGGGDVGGAYRLRAHYATLPTSGGGVGRYLGETAAAGDGVLAGGDNPDGIHAAIHNGNLAGVTAGCGPGASAAEPLGIELRIPFSALGGLTGSDCIRITTFVNSAAHDFVSNQFLAPLTPGLCSLGDPRTVDLSLQPGAQFFAKCLPSIGVEPPSVVPAPFAVRAWPNPATGEIRLRWDGAASPVRASVYDVSGRRVRVLDTGSAPVSELSWDGRSATGERLSAGLYFVRVRVGESVQTLRVVLLP